MYHFCTYFDQNYLPRGLALYHSLAEHADPFVLYVLCFDDFTYEALSNLNQPNLHPISLEMFEQNDPALLSAKQNRSLVEYYFTCTPSLPLYILNHFPDVDIITYLDADLYFYANPAPLYQELGQQSVLIVGHRFPEHLRYREKFGIYNVSIQSFRNNDEGRTCLQWWRERCLEWCYDRFEDDRFADQKYLDDWPSRFSGVVVLQHKGAGLAPWNVINYSIQEANGSVLIDADPLVVYHFHDLKIITSHIIDPGLAKYGKHLDHTLIQTIYAPYLRELLSLSNQHKIEAITTIRKSRSHSLSDLTRAIIFGRMLLVIGSTITKINIKPFFLPLINLKNFIQAKKRPSALDQFQK